METQVGRSGNSLALRIPKAMVDRLGLGEGRAVELTVGTDRLVVWARDAEPTLEELLAVITPENRPESFDLRSDGDEAL